MNVNTTSATKFKKGAGSHTGHTDTRITQTNLTTIQTHQRTRTTAEPTPEPTEPHDNRCNGAGYCRSEYIHTPYDPVCVNWPPEKPRKPPGNSGFGWSKGQKLSARWSSTRCVHLNTKRP